MLPESDAFLQSLEPLRGALRLHCYRMLGSAHDGDDVVQETLLRAWRARDTLADRAQLKPWLYRIATNACYDELKKRPRRLLATDAFPPTEDARPPLPRVEEPVWLEPMPNTWLEGVDERDPQARYALKESVALAFVAALQCLSPVQRATLLLRDVVGLSAAETAGALGMSLEGANSALFRARAALASKCGGGEPADIAATAQVDEALLERYVRAFEEANLDEIVALFHRDVRTTMPPAPTWVSGRAANERFYRLMFGSLLPGQFRHLSIGANGQPALAFYRRPTADAEHVLAAIQLVTTRDGAIVTVDHFMLPEVYPLFDVPRLLKCAPPRRPLTVPGRRR
ncbi:MAG TPA: RNA polymerase subunit sigma-70 [Polyangiaceae bacterium]|nr:RNA polymerase subunit sigma-70 [Polyangiaceae bacterium]